MKTCRNVEYGSVPEPNREEAEIVAVRAAQWFMRLNGPTDLSDRQEFVRWLKESPVHVREMLIASVWDQALDEMLDPERKIDIDVPTSQQGTRVAERAREWLERMRRSHSPIDRARLVTWLKISPQHVREMLILTTWGDRPNVALASEQNGCFDARIRQGEAVRDGGGSAGRGAAAVETVVVGPCGRQDRRTGWSRLAGLSAAACLSIALALGWSHVGERSASQQQFATAIGEQRSVDLSDGSNIHLNTQSNVRIVYSDRARDVYLADGQAIFTVKHDAARPFRVHVNSTVVQAIGTQFDVRRLKDRTTVAVIEGAVQVISAARDSLDPEALSKLPESTKIGAGEAAVIDADGKLARDAIDVQRTVAWQEGRLVFLKSTLAEIAAEFNRYNKAPKIRVEGEALRARRFTLIFNAADPQSLFDYLSMDKQIAFVRSGDELVIRMQPKFVQAPLTPRSQSPDMAGSED